MIATALHVVKALETDKSSYHEGYLNIGAEKYTPTNDFAFSISVKVFAIDEVNDLALLSFDPAEIATQWKQFRVKPLKLSTSLPQIGDDVLLTGFLGNDIEPFTSIGTVAVIPSKSSDQDFPVMNEPIYSDLTSIPGFSGGPLFSIQRGEVVGVSIRILYPNKDYVRGSVAVNSLRLRELLEKTNAN